MFGSIAHTDVFKFSVLIVFWGIKMIGDVTETSALLVRSRPLWSSHVTYKEGKRVTCDIAQLRQMLCAKFCCSAQGLSNPQPLVEIRFQFNLSSSPGRTAYVNKLMCAVDNTFCYKLSPSSQLAGLTQKCTSNSLIREYCLCHKRDLDVVTK